jgi:hypothetical protein
MKRFRFLLAALLCGVAALALGGEFTILDRAGAARIADPTRHARPTVLALWSYDCAYCKKNLELFAAMAGAHPGLQLLTVAAEPADDRLAALLDRLAVPGQRFAYGEAAPEVLAYALDPKWRGELPRTILFDGRGGRVALSGVVAEAAALRALGLVAGKD